MSDQLRKRSTADAARAHLLSELGWLRVALNVHTRRLQRQGLLPSADDREAGAAVTGEEARSRMQPSQRRLFEVASDLSEEELAALRAADARRGAEAEALTSGGVKLPLQRLARRFHLSEEDALLLLLALANELDPDFPRIFAFINNHIDRQYPTLALVMDCLMARPFGALALRQRLDPLAPLVRYRLLELADDPGAKTLPQRPLVASQRALRYALGQTGLDLDLRPFATLTDASQHEAPLILSARDAGAMQRLLAMLTAHRERPHDAPLVALRGPDGVGRRRWVEEVAARMDRSVLCVDLTALASTSGGVGEGLRVALREARLQRALLCLSGWERLLRAAAPPQDGQEVLAEDPLVGVEGLSLELERALDGERCFVALRVDPTTETLPRLRRGVELVDLSLPAVGAAATLWARALAPCAHSVTDPLAFAKAYKLTPGQIQEAVAAAAAQARYADAPAPALTAETLHATVKAQVRHRLGDNATFIAPKYQWGDLIVAPDVILQLRELISRVVHRHKVLQEWDFARRFGADVGVSALFEGPPGTGKTMAASIIAGELGMDLFQIDLSQVVSKYIGETEKHLAKLFDEAERAQAVLLFDEADSLFSKRTSVKSSNDRYANLKVNYLLQRIERFSGIAILTTNFPESLDSAFSRRLSVRVRFEDPGPRERLRLWQTMLGEREVAEGVDFVTLSERFEMTGALIRNAVLRGAFMAAARDQRMDTDLLSLASRIELKQQGKLIQGDPIEDLLELDAGSYAGG